jgi:hypothetical protein
MLADHAQNGTYRGAFGTTIKNTHRELALSQSRHELTYVESCRIAAHIIHCHTQGDLDFGTVLCQANICLDPLYSQSDSLLRLTAACT